MIQVEVGKDFLQTALIFSVKTHCHLFNLFTFIEIWSCLGLGWLTFSTNISDWYGLSLSWFNRLKSSKKEFEFCTSGFTPQKTNLTRFVFFCSFTLVFNDFTHQIFKKNRAFFTPENLTNLHKKILCNKSHTQIELKTRNLYFNH